MKPLHAELKALTAKIPGSPAGYIRTDYFAYMTLGSLQRAAKSMAGKEIKAGTGVLSASVRELKWSNPPDLTVVPEKLDHLTGLPLGNGKGVDLKITSEFELTLDVFVSGKRNLKISEVAFKVSDARIRIQGVKNEIVSSEATIEFTHKTTRVKNADELLAAEKIELEEAARVEGHLEYGVAPQAVRKALSQPISIPLSQFFPALDFGTAISLAVLSGGRALGIIPSSRVLPGTVACCNCNNGPELKMSPSAKSLVVPADPARDTKLGTVEIGGPMPEGKDPLTNFGLRVANGEGMVGVYIPLEFAIDLIGKPMPAIQVSLNEGSGAGFAGDATVAFESLKVTIDEKGGGFLVDVEMKLSLEIYCWVEILCVKLPIGWANVKPAPGSSAKLQMGFYPSASVPNGVQLKATLNSIDMGNYVAMVLGIGSALALFGVTAWIALLDTAIALLITLLLPNELKEAIQKKLGHNEWRLMEGLSPPDPSQPRKQASPFDASKDSILISYDLMG